MPPVLTSPADVVACRRL